MKASPLIRAAAIAALMLAMLAPGRALADESLLMKPGLNVYFFWREGCPYCAKEKVFMQEIAGKYAGVKIYALESIHDTENARALQTIMNKLGRSQVTLPATVIGNSVVVGFSADSAREIEYHIRKELGLDTKGYEPEEAIDLPVFGKVKPSDFSLPVFTLVIAGLDSFNPCALFVLLFLLSLMIHARSRLRMLVVGGTFVFFSGFIYFLFMAAWLNFFFVAGNIRWLTAGAGAVALVIGVINVKDFFAFKKGVSLTMSHEEQNRLITRMRGLLKADSMASMLAGTAALAVAANAYELLCTAGFPMVYTRVLTLKALPTSSYYLYLAYYNVVYVVPLAVVVGIFTATLGGRKLTEGQGRFLKLLSGVMMFVLGAVLAFRPALLNNILASSAMLIGAAGLAGLIAYLWDRRG